MCSMVVQDPPEVLHVGDTHGRVGDPIINDGVNGHGDGVAGQNLGRTNIQAQKWKGEKMSGKI